MKLFRVASLALAFCLCSAVAQVPTARAAAPVITEGDRASADLVRRLPEVTPTDRMNQIIEARKLSDGARFDLALTHPHIVEHLYNEKFDLIFEYIDLMPPAEFHRIRKGETVIRTDLDLRGREKEIAGIIGGRFNFPKYKPEKVVAVRMGSINSQVWLFEVKYKRNKRKEYTEAVSLAWVSSLERDEESRDLLSKAFGARPSRVSRGTGSILALGDGSFEAPYALNDAWSLVEALSLTEARTPMADVQLDQEIYLDGSQSVRFYAEERTRLFFEVAQKAPVKPGQALLATSQVRGEDLRVEHQQREDHVCMTLSFLDAAGNPVGGARRAIARLQTYPWTPLVIEEVAPPGAAFARVAVFSGVSGTAWFDAVEIEVLE